MKTDKYFNATYSCLIGIALLFSGISMIIGRKWLYINLINIFIAALFFISFKQLIDYFIGKDKEKGIKFLTSIVNIVFCFIFMLFKDIPLSILPIVFGFYLLINGLIKFFNFFIIMFSKSNGYLRELIIGIIYWLFAFPSIFMPIRNLDAVLVVIGIYLLILGINYLFDFIGFIMPPKVKNRVKGSIRITLPAFIEAIIPYFVLKEINYMIDKDNYDTNIENKEKEKNVKADIEVFVHISNRGYNRLGHAELCYKDKIIAFGGYDDDSLRFHMLIADGVLVESDREKYIPFCIEHSKKTLFCFGLKLSDKKKKQLEEVLDSIYKESYVWHSPYEVALKKSKSKKIKDDKYKDYASKLYQATHAKYYKFNKGDFKKFFVVGNSCCNLVDYVLGKKGIDVLNMYGVITPGSYYEYLNREFQKKNSMVIYRKIYNSKNIDKKTIAEVFKGFSK